MSYLKNESYFLVYKLIMINLNTSSPENKIIKRKKLRPNLTPNQTAIYQLLFSYDRNHVVCVFRNVLIKEMRMTRVQYFTIIIPNTVVRT